ncbi:hypothetical protein [Nostoc sp. 106C]|uniref:hypothetical protein n=1 Tax=Nostoc sp. 106C TaxID=1932667 RepID=UPI000A3B140E|nr:hypothetical protein [Nostoc sp. 106C]OUL29102.1 hypothetical protein BV375_16340 [Nostoc sp. 106C]
MHQPITIYQIGGIGGAYNLYLPKEEEVFLALPEAILVQYTALDGKHIDSSKMEGKLTKLSLKAAEISFDKTEASVILAPLTNLKLNLLMPNSAVFSEDIYAKVVEPATENSFYIHFTNKPPDVEKQLSTLYGSIKTSQ